MENKKKVLFVCTQNSARSQMSEAILSHFHGDKYEAYSAGINPYIVNPVAVEVMKNIGIDMSSHRSKSIDEYLNEEFDVVITVCDNAKEHCPHIAGSKKNLHHTFTNKVPVTGTDAEIFEGFERLRDEIKNWIDNSVAQGII